MVLSALPLRSLSCSRTSSYVACRSSPVVVRRRSSPSCRASASPTDGSSPEPSDGPSGTSLAVAACSMLAGVGLFVADRTGVMGGEAAQKTPPLSELAAMAVPFDAAMSKTSRPTVVEFYADWCSMCKEMAPETFVAETGFKDEVDFVMINVDNPKWLPEMQEYGVDGIPEFVFLDEKKDVKGITVGLLPKGALSENMKALREDQGELPFVKNALLARREAIKQAEAAAAAEAAAVEMEMTPVGPRAHSWE